MIIWKTELMCIQVDENTTPVYVCVHVRMYVRVCVHLHREPASIKFMLWSVGRIRTPVESHLYDSVIMLYTATFYSHACLKLHNN